jgi:hypothetical protein
MLARTLLACLATTTVTCGGGTITDATDDASLAREPDGGGAGAPDAGTGADGGGTDAPPPDAPPPPAPLPPLPPPAPAATPRFREAAACAPCHLADPGPAMRDAAGRDVSPSRLWPASMMALSARDPFWLAVFSAELAARPGARETIERACTRCHAPAGFVERERAGGHLGFDDVVAGTTPEAALAREGVTCTMCHQIAAAGLGTPASFSGGYEIGDERRIYGPHDTPLVAPMVAYVSYTPVASAHARESALCATCHTVITRAIAADGTPAGPPFVEQAPYLEWRNSDYDTEVPGRPLAESCQSCHMPTVDEDGAPIVTAISNFPWGLGARSPFGRHTFVGGNAYMLRVLAGETAWAGVDVAPGELLAAADATEATLPDAARLAITSATRQGDTLVVVVRVENRTGHKLPTGYPTRRVWLDLRVSDAGSGAVRFESGACDASGALVGGIGQRLDGPGVILPHRDVIQSPDEVQVWEAVPVDAGGAPTHLLLDAVGFAKDDRILPIGWSPAHPDAAATAPVGVAGDASFGGGVDEVTYRVPVPAGVPVRVDVTLRYQAVPPGAVEPLAGALTPAAVRFLGMVASAPPKPSVIATAGVDVP